MAAKIDHLVYGAADLAAGTDWMTRQLGVSPSGGGKHDQMGTHNTLWRLGDIYLEVIAIDPAGTAPDRPRWFGLDAAATQARLAENPQLLTWVLDVDDLDAALDASIMDHGVPMTLSRGDFNWTVTIPDDGLPRLDGALPGLITWHSKHPVAALPDCGVKLNRFILPEDSRSALAAVGADHLVTFGDRFAAEFIDLSGKIRHI